MSRLWRHPISHQSFPSESPPLQWCDESKIAMQRCLKCRIPTKIANPTGCLWIKWDRTYRSDVEPIGTGRLSQALKRLLLDHSSWGFAPGKELPKPRIKRSDSSTMSASANVQRSLLMQALYKSLQLTWGTSTFPKQESNLKTVLTLRLRL